MLACYRHAAESGRLAVTVPITAFIVRVPEAEPLVEKLRLRFDATASLGVPAHITVLIPFMPPASITPEVLAAAREAFTSIRAFTFALDEVCRWPETTYLSPAPTQPFIELTKAIIRKFPEFPPYAGKHSEIIPHLTVADGQSGAAEAAEAELRPLLEELGIVRGRCHEIELLENSLGRWRIMHTIPLPRE